SRSTFAISARSTSSPTRRASQWESRFTSWSSGLVDIGGQQHIRVDLVGMQAPQLDRHRQLRCEDDAGTRDLRRDEQLELVDEILAQESTGDGRPSFEQQRLHALGGERRQLCVERSAPELQLGVLRKRAASEDQTARLAWNVDITRR